MAKYTNEELLEAFGEMTLVELSEFATEEPERGIDIEDAVYSYFSDPDTDHEVIDSVKSFEAIIQHILDMGFFEECGQELESFFRWGESSAYEVHIISLFI